MLGLFDWNSIGILLREALKDYAVIPLNLMSYSDFASLSPSNFPPRLVTVSSFPGLQTGNV
jgi:hypothetical protein